MAPSRPFVGGCEFLRGGITDIENIADKFDFDEFSAKGARAPRSL
ncbi:Hypothetical protein BSPT1_I0662 [Brucella suis bv. 2]|nr:Hypothetical protein BSPT1_I0662 [Brucella suis bv. 2]AIB24120.1 Hypothetical protein BSPT2_I0650 [Brucella suis bv. 2]